MRPSRRAKKRDFIPERRETEVEKAEALVKEEL
jgi:hypothetical protein